MTLTISPMTDAEIRKAIRKKPSWCCGDPATCQGITGPDSCPLDDIYQADLKARRMLAAESPNV
jgi:hypothetical protein